MYNKQIMQKMFNMTLSDSLFVNFLNNNVERMLVII